MQLLLLHTHTHAEKKKHDIWTLENEGEPEAGIWSVIKAGLIRR